MTETDSFVCVATTKLCARAFVCIKRLYRDNSKSFSFGATDAWIRWMDKVPNKQLCIEREKREACGKICEDTM